MKRRTFLQNASLATLGLGIQGIACISAGIDAEVLVLGAGLAGLQTTRLLEAQGISCKILEADSRVGGRLLTRYQNDQSIEFGGVEVGDNYQRVLEVANAVGIELVAPPRFSSDVLIHINGHSSKASDWEVAPYFLQSAACKNKIPFETLYDWGKKKYAATDIPFAQFLRNAGYDEESIRLINVNGNFNEIEQISTNHIFRSIFFRKNSGSRSVLAIKEGSSRLPEAMAEQLQSEILKNKVVQSIKEEKDKVLVRCADGTQYRAKQLVCTLPFSVLRTLELEANFSLQQKKAINELPYTRISQIAFAPKNKFWEEDGLPLTMWTDSPLERIFTSRDKSGEVQYFKAFINGAGTKNIDRLNSRELKELTSKTLKNIRPSTENNIEILDTFSWANHPFSKGAYAEFHAGQATGLSPYLAQGSPRIHFAGEHTALEQKGMEGALASAERVVKELIKKIENNNYD